MYWEESYLESYLPDRNQATDYPSYLYEKTRVPKMGGTGDYASVDQVYGGCDLRLADGDGASFF
jgi:hypothetical protein